MFQYAAGRSLAEVNNCQLKLDISGYKDYSLHNGYELGLLNIEAEIISQKEISTFKLSRLERFIRQKFKIQRNFHFIEKSFLFDDKFFELKHPVYLDGYWQSYKYFESIEPLLRREFIPKKCLTGLNLEISEQMANLNSVSLHIRRGDYITNRVTNKVHGFLGIEYYKRCIEIIKERINSPYFFIFSDDIAWVKENLELTGIATYVDNNHAKDSFEDMRLMSLCQHHIIANSSFSWWGSWLGQNPDKMVLYPNRWFATDDRDTSTLCPPAWEVVEV